MREIQCSTISDAVSKLCIESNYYLNSDIRQALNESLKAEKSVTGRDIIEKLIENADIAADKKMAICQDTGMAMIFVDIGQDVHIVGGSLTDAINEGVRQGYKEGYLRKSIVRHPINRVNTGDNTPAVIHYEIVPGDKLHITVAPKGFGSENMSSLKMLKPSEGEKGVREFVIETISKAGANPCPPIVVGVGVGGSMEKAALLAKKALLRPLGTASQDVWAAEFEKQLLLDANKLGIGPQGFGGNVTALGIHVDVYPTHIAGLPVAVNISCHVTRHGEVEL